MRVGEEHWILGKWVAGSSHNGENKGLQPGCTRLSCAWKCSRKANSGQSLGRNREAIMPQMANSGQSLGRNRDFFFFTLE